MLGHALSYAFGGYEGVLHQVVHRRKRADVVEAVGSLQRLVNWVVHDSGRQCVETHEVCHFTVILSKTNYLY